MSIVYDAGECPRCHPRRETKGCTDTCCEHFQIGSIKSEPQEGPEAVFCEWCGYPEIDGRCTNDCREVREENSSLIKENARLKELLGKAREQLIEMGVYAGFKGQVVKEIDESGLLK